MSPLHKNSAGLGRIVRAAGFSLAGLKAAYRNETAFRQESWLCLFLVPAAFFAGTTWVETALLAGSAVLVLIVELLNSGIEAVVDRVSLELHDLSKRAKDLGSAAVMLSVLLCCGTWAGALWARFGPWLLSIPR